MTEQPDFQLEVFNGRVYEPVATGTRRALEPEFERLASKGRLPRPSYRPPTGGRGAKTRDETISAYLAWAKAKGLPSVAVYRDQYVAVEKFGLTARYVDVADFLGDAPVAELEA